MNVATVYIQLLDDFTFQRNTETEYAVLNYDDMIVRGFAEKTKAVRADARDCEFFSEKETVSVDFAKEKAVNTAFFAVFSFCRNIQLKLLRRHL